MRNGDAQIDPQAANVVPCTATPVDISAADKIGLRSNSTVYFIFISSVGASRGRVERTLRECPCRARIHQTLGSTESSGISVEAPAFDAATLVVSGSHIKSYRCFESFPTISRILSKSKPWFFSFGFCSYPLCTPIISTPFKDNPLSIDVPDPRP